MQEPRTHDYSKREWGHDYVCRPIDPQGLRAKLTGWGNIIRQGDYLILEGNDPGSTTRYRVDEVRYEIDPKDMWHITASFAPRQND